MFCGLRAARSILGSRHDLLEVNTERSYCEEQRIDEGGLLGRTRSDGATIGRPPGSGS